MGLLLIHTTVSPRRITAWWLQRILVELFFPPPTKKNDLVLIGWLLIVKNIIYCALFDWANLLGVNLALDLAKVSPHILSAEKFGMHLGVHILSRYEHLHKAFVTIEQLRWTRIPVDGEQGVVEHPHSFYRDGDEKRVVKIEVSMSL